MILVSLGTHHQPFPRALDAIETLVGFEQIVVQYGHTPPRRDRGGIRWLQFVRYDDMVSYMQRASGIVCHAGVGTIITALSVGKLPVVIPRRRLHGEHVDDHQLQIARQLEAREFVITLEDEDLSRALARAGSLHRRRNGADSRLLNEVRLASHRPTSPGGRVWARWWARAARSGS